MADDDAAQPRLENHPVPGLDIRALASTADDPGSTTRFPVETWSPPFCGEIDMRIARDGTWYYRGTPIRRQRLVRLFSRILRKNEDRYVLVTPVEMVGIEVEDAPFLGVEMKAGGDGTNPVLRFRTNVEDWVSLDADHPIRFEIADSDGLKPYILVRGNLWALLTRSLALDLIERAEIREHHGGTWLGLASAGLFFPITKVEGSDDGGTIGEARAG
jgi:hypothetical protein